MNYLAGTMLTVLRLCIDTALNEPVAHREGKKHSEQTVPVPETYDNTTEKYGVHFKYSTLTEPQFSINIFELF